MFADEIENESETEIPQKPGARVVEVAEPKSESEESADTITDEEDLEHWLAVCKEGEIQSDYWYIQKLLKHMKTGNQTITADALICLKDLNLRDEMNHHALQIMGGLEIFVNLLESMDLKCKLGSLKVLLDITENFEIRRHITFLGGVPLLVNLLNDPTRDLQILAAEVIANVALVRKARKYVRQSDGIPKLVDMLDVNQKCLMTVSAELQEDDLEWVHIASAGAKALHSCSLSKRNMVVMLKCGVVTLLAKLIKSVHRKVVLPAMATLQQCASNPSYRLAVQTEKMIPDIVKHISNNDPELSMYCASAIFHCAIDEEMRHHVLKAGGLNPLVSIARDPKHRDNKPLLIATSGALWKCALSDANVKRLDQLNLVGVLVDLLKDENEDVLTNVVGALAECTKFPTNRDRLRGNGGIPPLVNLLNGTHAPLLVNVARVLEQCAQEISSMEKIEEMDGLRLVWSLLKNPNPNVQEHAAWALCPCVQNATESGERIRELVGGLELTVTLLKSKHNNVLAAVCAAIAVIAKDIENLAVITDHGVIPQLSSLVETEDDLLREHLASAIANCCAWGSNCKEFGRRGAITPLVGYLAAHNPKVHRTTALATYALSENAFNCITMHESGIVQLLLSAVGSKDKVLQEAAAGCLRNIRRLAFEAETFHLFDNANRYISDEEDD